MSVMAARNALDWVPSMHRTPWGAIAHCNLTWGAFPFCSQKKVAFTWLFCHRNALDWVPSMHRAPWGATAHCNLTWDELLGAAWSPGALPGQR